MAPDQGASGSFGTVSVLVVAQPHSYCKDHTPAQSEDADSEGICRASLWLDALATTAHRRHGRALFRFLAGRKTY
jgi:hypothetical protein